MIDKNAISNTPKIAPFESNLKEFAKGQTMKQQRDDDEEDTLELEMVAKEDNIPELGG